MFDSIVAFLQSLPHELYVFIISVLPLIELRGAVPVGAALGIPFYWNFLVSVTGNMLPIPFILLFIPKILDFLGKFKLFRPMVEWIRRKAEKNKGKIIKSAEGGADTSSDTALPCHLPLGGEGSDSAECKLPDGAGAESGTVPCRVRN